MGVRVSEARSIGFLINKYKTKQPGEIMFSDDLINEYGMHNWRNNQKIIEAKLIMNQLNMKNTQRSRVIHILKKIDNMKELCQNCSCRTIILIVCFYIMKIDNPKTHIERYQLWKDENLSWKKYALVVSRLCDRFQKNSFL